jgi:hypothetical protein
MYYEFARQGGSLSLLQRGVLSSRLITAHLYYEFAWLAKSLVLFKREC